MLSNCPRVFVLLTGVSLIAALSCGVIAQEKPGASKDDARSLKPLREIAAAPLPADAAKSPPPADGATVQQACDEARQMLNDDGADAALRRLEAVLSDETVKSCNAFTLAAEAEWTRERPKEARAFLNQALALSPADLNANYLQALLEAQQNEPEQAIAHFRRATLAAEDEMTNPRGTLAWLQLGQTLAKSGYTLAAAQALERFDRDLWELFPERRNYPQLSVYLAQYPLGALSQRLELLAQAGRNEERVRAVNAALERWPDKPDVLKLAVSSMLAGKQPAEAFAIVNRHLNEVNFGGIGLALAARAAQASGKIESLLATAKPDADQLRRLAATLNTAGDSATAQTVAEAALKAQPDNARAALEAARARMLTGDAAAGITRLAQFIRANPPKILWTSRDFAAWVAKEDDRLALKKALYARESAGDRDFADNFVLGLAAAALQDDARAETLLQASATAQPDFAAAPAASAALYNSRYAWQKTREFVEPLLKARPDAAGLHFELARALDGLDENEAAQKEYRAAIRLSPGNNAYCIACAEHNLRILEYPAAIRFYQQACDNDAQDAVALEGLFDSSIRGEKYELARNIFDKLDAADPPEDAVRRMRTTLRFLKNAFTHDHLVELKEQFAAHPEDVRTGLVLAAGLFLVERHPESRAVIQQVVTTEPENENAQFLSARLDLAEAEFTRAADGFERLLQRFPNRDELLIWHSRAAHYDFRTPEVRADLARLAERRPDAKLTYRGDILETYTELADYAGALQLIEKWLAENWEPDRLISVKIGLLGAAGKSDEAWQMAQTRLDAKPEDALRRSDYVAAAKAVKAYDAAETKLRAWLQAEPQQSQYFRDLEQILLKAEKGDALLELVDSIAAAGNAQARHYLRGIELGHLRRAKEAVAEYDELLKGRNLPPAELQDIRKNLIDACINGDELDLALERCEKWLAAAENRDQATWLQALKLKYDALSAAERMPEAVVVGQKLLEYPRNRNRAGLNNDIGYTWADMGINLDRALPMVQQALGSEVVSEPPNAMYLDSLGWVYYKRGDFERARHLLENTVRLERGRDGTIYDHLGDARWRTGQHAEAYATWKQAADALKKQLAERRQPRYEELLANVEKKLATQGAQEAPHIAPTAAEQHPEKP